MQTKFQLLHGNIYVDTKSTVTYYVIYFSQESPEADDEDTVKMDADSTKPEDIPPAQTVEGSETTNNGDVKDNTVDSV